ncbi:vWA domain-containing protein [Deinococcus radiophilus]|uniref:VWA domain-containing protein n=1 Tax=Deinococcus radiophilus TaxID=32062 RepID=A0A431VY13_9DEIO|nr:VWA domain-containing protein [Deinococcus radiophilus]RTR28033.1 VWA domain-containing protein [Deinococcus radiophilus]UFA51513.1 VWA domain-containing protein [Deinococcus radiophilus]
MTPHPFDPSSGEQLEFDLSHVEFAENPEPRCPVLLLLDNSGSMAGERIAQLNEGLQVFKADLMADSLAAKRCEIGIVSFGPVQQVTDFVSVLDFEPPTLQPLGDTPLGGAVTYGLELLRQRKETIRQNGVALYRPWVFLITDGAPTDDWHAAAAAVREGEAAKSFAFFSVGVQGADLSVLGQIGGREPLMLSGVRFRELFQWLSSSLRSVSQSMPGDRVVLESPAGWAEV